MKVTRISHDGFSSDWGQTLKSPVFRLQLATTFVILLFLARFISIFFKYIQQRPALSINDSLLQHIEAYDVSQYIFLLIYVGLISGIFYLLRFPDLLLQTVQAYCLLTLLRCLTLFLVPLDPPHGLLPLRDPIVDNLFYGNGVITKDLFFSGHVSTIFLFVLAVPSKLLKYLFLVLSLSIGVLTLVQHVHYTIDILAAPLFSWISYELSRLVNRRVKGYLAHRGS